VFGAYPEPVSVTVDPTEPVFGVRVNVGVVTTKFDDAVSAVTVATSLPEMTTAFVPVALDGTVKLQENVPDVEVV
jgi:hypothetical protein